MLTITADKLSAIQRASRGLRGLLISLLVIAVLGVLTNLTHPLPQGAKVLAGVEFCGATSRILSSGTSGPITCQS
jgi:hypothetical protein